MADWLKTADRIGEAVPVATGRDILVVDDSRTNLQVIGRRLTRMGYRTMLCEGGASAVAQMHARRFDVVLLDMVMPDMSGIATLQEIRRTAAIAETPVMMMTARSDIGAAIEALAEGADDHLAKPFDFDVLGARIERLLARARAFDDLRRANAQLDARIASRAVEMGELKAQLAEGLAERIRLTASLRALEKEIAELRQARPAPA
ncbi:response regulator [Flavisphingomonas formosensis]|uniref:response regulator n=1 Tax=Flavisphingomonas formosensis TaxID=861534 RepID=UPI0012FA56F0|nr:response regulator [Sphingomonas formosensis]